MKRFGLFAIAFVLCIAFVNLNNVVSAAVPGINQQVDLRANGGYPNASGGGFIAKNGKVVLFNTNATNILSPQTGKGLFARDLATGVIDRVSVSTAGVMANGSIYSGTKISNNGRYVLFMSSEATNLIDGRTISNNGFSIYLRDRVESTTTLITQAPDGSTANASSEIVGISSDGRFVSFFSSATNLSTDAVDGAYHLFMLDRLDNSYSVLDRNSAGSVVGGAAFKSADMSCDGSLFAVAGANLIVGESTGHTDIYLLDLRGTSAKLTNLTMNTNTQANAPVISCNGDYVGFSSKGTDVDTKVTYTSNGYIRPYVFDRINGTYHLVATTTSNGSTNTPICGTVLYSQAKCLDVSDSGVAVFYANDSGLTGDSGMQVYIRDIHAKTTELVSKNSYGVTGNQNSSGFSITSSGSHLLYSSAATNLSENTSTNIKLFYAPTGR